MSARLIPAAQKIQADVAGHTSSEMKVPTQQGPQFSEVLTGIGSEYGGLSHLFGEGLAAVKPVVTDVSIPTDSIKGRLGGLMSRAGSVTSPGPGIQRVESAAAKVPGTLEKLRKRLGV